MAEQLVTSTSNPLLKEIRKAQEHGHATSDGLVIAEGPKLLAEARRSGLPIRVLVRSEETSEESYGAERVVIVSANLLRSIAGTKTPQGVIGLVEPPVEDLDAVLRSDLVVVLDGIQDPGNAGSIARAAEAFGAGLIFVKGSANPDHPKVLRASAGSMFRVPLVRGEDAAQVLAGLDQRFAMWCAVPAGASVSAIDEIDWRRPSAVVLGSEGHGVSDEFRSSCQAFTIPTRGVESLNVAMAASVILYEARRVSIARVL